MAAIIVAVSNLDTPWKIIFMIVTGLVIMYWDVLTGKKVQKKLGRPCRIDNGVQYYLSRRDLSFEEVVNVAKVEIVFVSVTHEIVASDKDNVVREVIVNKNIRVRVMVLDPDSEQVSYKERIFGIGVFARGDPNLSRSLQERIEDSLRSLRYLQRQLPDEKRDLLTIESYNFDIPTSLMIIDHGTDNACIKIEEHYSTENSRENKLVFHRDNPSYYNDYYHMYEEMLNLTRTV